MTELRKHILIVEDDESILYGLKDILENKGYKVSAESDGIKGLETALENPVNLVVLDVMLPGMNGFEVCKRIRQEKTSLSILMLTAKNSELDKISGLDYGADDYMTKPFSLSELLARIRAILRRSNPIKNSSKQIFFGNVELNFSKMEGLVHGKVIKFTRKELAILEYFMNRDGEIVHRHDLLNNIWGYDKVPTTRTVDTFISEIRKKIEEIPSKPKHIISVSGIGYKFISGNS